MSTETITVRVDSRAAQAFNALAEEDRRKLELLLSMRVLEVTQPSESLEQIMHRISQNAQQRGLTPEILADILNDHE